MKKRLTIIDFISSWWYNVIHSLGVICMKKLSPQRKLWLDRHSQQKTVQKPHKRKNSKEHFFFAPQCFSLLKNTVASIDYFDSIFTESSKMVFHEVLTVDVCSVTDITIDAVIYLLATIRDLRSKDIFKQHFRGSLPKKTSAKTVFEKSGFMSFVDSDYKELNVDNNNIKIMSLSSVCPQTAQKICDFTNTFTSKSTKILYAILIELMTNASQHAYQKFDAESKKIDSGSRKFNKRWYIYAEHEKDCVNFVFFDTGLGIPSTIYKKLSEKAKDIFKKVDSNYIDSALKGSMRTETRAIYRGKGLPQIFDALTSGYFSSLKIISNNGFCEYEYAHAPKLNDISSSLKGSMFMFSISTQQEDE